MTLKQILKDWTLPFSMVVGTIGYLLFTQVAALHEAKVLLVSFVPYLLPSLIFVMLFFSYCKIEPRDLKPRRWHLWLILIQMAEVGVMVWWLMTHEASEWRPLAEAWLACFIAPMAAVGAVVTQKIGGNAATATTYTIISSTFTALAVPLVYPLVEPGIGLTFIELFLKILSRVFPTIMAPLALALLMKWFTPKAHSFVAEKSKDYSFYLWGICTAVNTAQIIRSIVSSPGSGSMVAWICFTVGIIVCLQFIVGKHIGSKYGDKIAAGQGLAQKNTVLSIWMAMSFLNPQAAIGPGACLLWQNLFNSWQIWQHQKESSLKTKAGHK
ncbi:MAG: transporter [Bacteroidales bacterium]|nr:transporter [Bacteroidales bacterium]